MDGPDTVTADPITSETLPGAEPPRRLLDFSFLRQASSGERRTLVAGGLGWMLDAMDVVLYSMVIAHLMGEFHMDTRAAGLLNSLTLVASAIGGLLFGFLADRVGRTRSLMASILVYSLASAASGFSSGVVQLAVFRFILGLGMGGEWSTGAALIAETWRPEHRGKALGMMQSTYAIGEVIAAGVVALILPRFGWRYVFFAGVLPALLVFWIRRGVPESEIWTKRAQQPQRGSLRILWREDIRWNGILATAMNACAMFGYWGLFTWIPAYLALPVSQGGRGLGLVKTTWWYIALCGGKWLGYVLFGFIADTFGRRKPYFAYMLIAAALVPVYGMATSPLWLLVLGPFVAFFGTGFFSGFSVITSELFPGEIRATAMGLSYNVGRGLSAAAPFAVGALARQYGLGSAFFLQAAAFFVGALLTLALPETKGKQLD